MADIMGGRKLERLAHEVARLDVDKTDIKRLIEFMNTRMTELMIVGQAHAKDNGRDIIQPQNLPIAKGLEANIKAFRDINVELEVAPIPEKLADVPDLHMAFCEATQAYLPQVLGGLSVSLAKVVKAIDPEVSNPQTEHWDKAREVFNNFL